MDADTDERRYAIATFSSRRDVQPNQFAATWQELVGTLTDHRVYPSKHDVWLWSPTRYRPGSTRGRKGVESVSLFVADIDDGTSGPEMAARLMLLGTSFLVVSTWSHTPEEPHLRAVVPLADPIPVQLYDDVWLRMNYHIFDSHIDPATKDPSRAYYGPSYPQERRNEVFLHGI